MVDPVVVALVPMNLFIAAIAPALIVEGGTGWLGCCLPLERAGVRVDGTGQSADASGAPSGRNPSKHRQPSTQRTRATLSKLGGVVPVR